MNVSILGCIYPEMSYHVLFYLGACINNAPRQTPFEYEVRRRSRSRAGAGVGASSSTRSRARVRPRARAWPWALAPNEAGRQLEARRGSGGGWTEQRDLIWCFVWGGE